MSRQKLPMDRTSNQVNMIHQINSIVNPMFVMCILMLRRLDPYTENGGEFAKKIFGMRFSLTRVFGSIYYVLARPGSL